MSYQLGDTAPETDTTVLLQRIDERTAEIQQFAKDEAVRRKWTVIFGVAGAVFAAIKLGIVAIPHIRRRRAHAVGELAPALANPARRRARRRR